MVTLTATPPSSITRLRARKRKSMDDAVHDAASIASEPSSEDDSGVHDLHVDVNMPTETSSDHQPHFSPLRQLSPLKTISAPASMSRVPAKENKTVIAINLDEDESGNDSKPSWPSRQQHEALLVSNHSNGKHAEGDDDDLILVEASSQTSHHTNPQHTVQKNDSPHQHSHSQTPVPTLQQHTSAPSSTTMPSPVTMARTLKSKRAPRISLPRAHSHSHGTPPQSPSLMTPSPASKSQPSPRTVMTRGSPAMKPLELAGPVTPIATPSFRALPLKFIVSVSSVAGPASPSLAPSLAQSQPVSSRGRLIRLRSDRTSPSLPPSLSNSHSNAQSQSTTASILPPMHLPVTHSIARGDSVSMLPASDNTPAAQFHRHSWCLWQLRCQYLLNELRRKARKLGGGGSVNGKRGKAKSNDGRQSRSFQFTASGGSYSNNSSPSSALFEHSTQSTPAHCIDDTSAPLPAKSVLGETHDTDLSCDIVHDNDIQVATLAACPAPDASNDQYVAYLTALIPPHHASLTLPVIEAMTLVTALTVPPSVKHNQLFQTVAACIQLPLPASFESLNPTQWESQHFFNYQSVSQSQSVSVTAALQSWTMPDDYITVYYPHSMLPHHVAMLETYDQSLSKPTPSQARKAKHDSDRRQVKRQKLADIDTGTVSGTRSSALNERADSLVAKMKAAHNLKKQKLTQSSHSVKITHNDGRIGGRKSKMTTAEKKLLNESRAGLYRAKLQRILIVLATERRSREMSGETVPRYQPTTLALTPRQALPRALYEAIERECKNMKVNGGVERAWRELRWMARLIVTRGIKHLMPGEDELRALRENSTEIVEDSEAEDGGEATDE